MDPAYFALNWRPYVALYLAGAVVIAGVGVWNLPHPAGWGLLAISVLGPALGLSVIIPRIQNSLRVDVTGLFLLWRGRERQAFSWSDVLGMAWAPPGSGKGTLDFCVVRADGSSSRMPVPFYTRRGKRQAEAIVEYWKHAVPGLTVLDETAKAPFTISGHAAPTQAWYREPASPREASDT